MHTRMLQVGHTVRTHLDAAHESYTVANAVLPLVPTAIAAIADTAQSQKGQGL